MKTIQLRAGYSTIVDDDDYEWLKAMKWIELNNRGRVSAIRYVKSRMRYMHREIMKASPGQIVDHINGNILDNRKSNLRLATTFQNAANKRKVWGESGFKGVCKSRNSYTAKLIYHWKTIYLGSYATPEEAARAYDAGAIKYFGEFAATNKELGLID